MTTAVGYYKLINKNIDFQLSFLNDQKVFIESTRDSFAFKNDKEYEIIYDFYKNSTLDEYIVDMDDIDCINKKISHLTNYKKEIEKQINKLCFHEFVQDNIDIDLDTSQSINYCIHCDINYADCCFKKK